MSSKLALKMEDGSSYVNTGDQPFFDNNDNDEEDIEITLKVPSCENMDSSMNEERLEKLLQSCNPGYQLVIPKAGERCHRFDSLKIGLPIPPAVISTSFFKLGFSLHMHPFFLELLHSYNLAPM